MCKKKNLNIVYIIKKNGLEKQFINLTHKQVKISELDLAILEII